MIISDLTYMETAAEEVVGAGMFFNFAKNIKTNVVSTTVVNSVSNTDINFNKDSRINAKVNVKGNGASFVFDNEAVGPNSDTETVINQITIYGGGSSQNGQVVSGTSW